MGLMSKLRRLLLAALFLAAPLAAWCEDAGKPDTALARISSLFQTPNPFGAEIFADYYGVFQGNPVGGLSQDFAYSQYLIFGMKSKEPLGWRGGGFKISAVSAAGRDLSEEIGNAFTVSQAWAGNSLFFYECFITQRAFDDRLELGLGRMAASEFFGTLPAFDLLVTGGLNAIPIALGLNSPFTESSSASWAAGARWHQTEEISLTIGASQATAPLASGSSYQGLDLGFRGDEGILAVAEAGWTPNPETSRAGQGTANTAKGLPGIYKLGAYASNRSLADYPGGSGSAPMGLYALAQQAVWEECPGAKIPSRFSLFGGAVWSLPNGAAEMPWSGFFGTDWRGPFATRPADHFYTSWQIGNFGNAYAKSLGQSAAGAFESVLNAGYIFQLSEEFSVQPDIQYIIRPGGFGQSPNALVLGLQISLSL
jgi:porin